MADAAVVLDEGDPETVAAVKAGKLSVSKAAQNSAAERKGGELLAGMDLKPGPKNGNASTLEAIGLERTQSHRWQRSPMPPNRANEADKPGSGRWAAKTSP